MNIEQVLELNRKYDEELTHIIGDPQLCLLYGSKDINPDKNDIITIKTNLYNEFYEGKSIFDKCSFEKV